MRLDELPDEILLILFDFVDKGDRVVETEFGFVFRDRYTVHNLIGCCKRFQPLAEEILYSSALNLSQPQLQRFLRTMLFRTDLANGCVNQLGACCDHEWKYYQKQSLLSFGELCAEISTEVRRILASVDPGKQLEHTEWITAICSGEFDSMFALTTIILKGLLFLAPPAELVCKWPGDGLLLGNPNQPHQLGPSSRTLRYFYNALHHCELVSPNTKDSEPILSHLQSVRIDFPNLPCGVGQTTDYITSFCRLPSVKEITVRMYNEMKFDIPLNVSFDNIQSVSLYIGSIKNDGSLERFIRCFPSLKIFRCYHDQGRLKWNRSEIPVTVAMNNIMVRMMLTTTPQLVKLRMPPEAYDYEHPPKDASDARNIESLVGFEHLTDLEVAAFDLWIETTNNGSDDNGIAALSSLLPASLVTLILHHVSEATISHLWSILNADASRTPNLRWILLRLHWRYTYEDPMVMGLEGMIDELVLMRDLLKQRGISLQWKRTIEPRRDLRAIEAGWV